MNNEQTCEKKLNLEVAIKDKAEKNISIIKVECIKQKSTKAQRKQH